MAETYNEPKPVSAVQPVSLSLHDTFQFRCQRGIACFNKCCENTDILLTPYDIVRLKNRTGLSSREFIDSYTYDCQLDSHGMPGLKLGHRQGSQACIFLTPSGCGVYEDRPSACRYYALGLMSLRKKDSAAEEDSYFVVKEAHCLGHLEGRRQTVAQYRAEQGIDYYDDCNREWRRIVLKKRSTGPTVGRPSQRSFELFFLASYDIDGFRAFVASEEFQGLFDLEASYRTRLLVDEAELLQFAFRYLRQVLYAEKTIAVRPQAAAARARSWREKRAAECLQMRAEQRAREQDEIYQALLDEERLDRPT